MMTVRLGSLYLSNVFDSNEDVAADTVGLGAKITKDSALKIAMELHEFVSNHAGEYGNTCCHVLPALQDT